MSKKLEFKKSAISNVSAVAPKQAVKQEVAEETRVIVKAATATGRKKASFYVSVEDDERIRAAFIAARNAGKPYRTLSDFNRESVLRTVEEIEAELNGGVQFAGVAAGSLPSGRPLD